MDGDTGGRVAVKLRFRHPVGRRNDEADAHPGFVRVAARRDGVFQCAHEAAPCLNPNRRMALPPRIAFLASSERNGTSQIVAGTSKSCAGKFEPHTSCVCALIDRKATSSAAGSSGISNGCEQ